MSENEPGDALEALLETPPGRERDLLIANLSAEERASVSSMLAVDDLVWQSAHGAPPLQSDPVAAMLGLVPDASFRLDAAAFARCCSRMGLRPTVLAERLRSRGWSVQAADVFRWQTSVASDVSPALIRVLAEEFSVEPDRLVSPPTAAQSTLDNLAEQVASTRQFSELTQRFARARHISQAMAQTMLRTRMLATAQRGAEPEVEQMLQALESLVEAFETD